MPFKFNLENIDRTGLDVLFYGQEHFDTMAILDDKREFNSETIGDMVKNQKVLGNRELMLKNFSKLVENLGEVEEYIANVVSGKQESDV